MSDRTIFNTQLTDVDTTARDPVGALRWEGGKLYKYVLFKNVTATVAGVAGDPVAYAIDSADGPENHKVVLDMTDADAQPVGAGLLMGTVAGVLATSYYCWIQLTGLATVPTAVTTGVLGSNCMMGTTDKTLVVATGVIHSCAVLCKATAANNTVLCKFPY